MGIGINDLATLIVEYQNPFLRGVKQTPVLCFLIFQCFQCAPGFADIDECEAALLGIVADDGVKTTCQRDRCGFVGAATALDHNLTVFQCSRLEHFVYHVIKRWKISLGNKTA